MSKQKNEHDTNNIGSDIPFAIFTAPCSLIDNTDSSSCAKFAAKTIAGSAAGGASFGTATCFTAKALGAGIAVQTAATILVATVGCCFGGIFACYACRCNPCACSSCDRNSNSTGASENDLLLQEPKQQEGMKK